jgi:hypothetical protein
MTLPNLTPLGPIVRLQIQRSGLKLGQKPNRVFDPSPLLEVQSLTLTPLGAVALLPDGSALLDVHHALHPRTRNNDGVNDLSVGFTSHYARMRSRYGPHLADGCAGENILVQNDAQIPLGAIQRGLAIQSAETGQWLWLHGVRVALPCVEFSTYAARPATPDDTKAALQFLDHGVRGFYCAYDGEQPATVKVGDLVWAATA